MRLLTETLLAAVCELEGGVAVPVREALARRYGPGSGWASGEHPAGYDGCPDWDKEFGSTWCDCCWRGDCRPGGTTLLREVCCVLWPWAADAIMRRQPPPEDDGEIAW